VSTWSAACTGSASKVAAAAAGNGAAAAFLQHLYVLLRACFLFMLFLSARAVLLRWLLLQRGVGQLLLSCNIYKGNCKRVFVHAFSMCTGSASTVAAAMLTLI